MEINGYFFRSLLKKTRRRFALSAGEQALYTELVDICNEEGWSTSFQVSNGELVTALNCSERTLVDWRQSLINAGLIAFNSGKSKRAFSTYTMVVKTTEKISPNTAVDRSTNSTTNLSTNSSDYNKLNKKETKLNNSKSHSGDKAPAMEKKVTIPFWKKFIAAFHEWYENHFHEKYSYLDKDFNHLKKLYSFFKNRADQKKMEFSEENLLSSFKFFLEKAWNKSEWLKNNFSIPNLLSQFNQIVNEAGNTKEKSRTGANVSTGSILSKIAGMPD